MNLTRPSFPLLLLLTGVLLAMLGGARAAERASLDLPMDREAALADWTFSEAEAQLITDDAAAAPAFAGLAVDSPASPSPYVVITAKDTLTLPVAIDVYLRLPTKTHELKPPLFSRADVRVTWRQPNARGTETEDYYAGVNRNRVRDRFSWNGEANGPVLAGATVRRYTPVYAIDAISPLMNIHERLLLEQYVDLLAPMDTAIQHIRLEIRADNLRAYANGRLLDDVAASFRPGTLQVSLRNNARILGVSARPLVDLPERFVTVPLESHFNAVDPALPPALQAASAGITSIDGVPFYRDRSGPGPNHLDLERSVYLHRMGDMRAGDSREAVQHPEDLDVTRFTLRVPPGVYRRAWFLVAADDDAHNTPSFTLRFYVPRTPWTHDAAAVAPSYTVETAPGDATRLATADGRSLWLVPVALDAAGLAADPMDCIEITKTIYPYRGYPDPAYYNSYPGGLPSAVHVYGLTLERAPIHARGTGSMNANLYVYGDRSTWTVKLKNLTDAPQDVAIHLTVTDPYGAVTTYDRQVTLGTRVDAFDINGRFVAPEPVDGVIPPHRDHDALFFTPTDVYGLHRVVTTVRCGDFEQSRTGTFLKLPPNLAKATPSESPWGLWSWNGGHKTNPDPLDNMRILRALGATNNFQLSEANRQNRTRSSLYPKRQQGGVAPMHYRLVDRTLPAWSMTTPDDPAAIAAYTEEKGIEAREALQENPDLQYVNFFAENYLSLRLSHGMPAWAMGLPPFELDEREAQRLAAHWAVAKAGLAAVREHTPQLKVLFGHCPANFYEPFFKLPDWDNAMFDGFGMDLPQFERMPERQPRATEPSLLYFLHHQMKEHGLLGKDIVHLESYFPSTGPMALTEHEQAASVMRTAMLSMSLGTTRFMRTWELHTSGDGWGGSHYGGAGLIDRAPEFNPKPAAVAFATMARVVDMAKFDGYLDVGSRSAFCLRFVDTDRIVYAVWTIRGTRPLDLGVAGDAQILRHDYQGNAFPVAVTAGAASVTLTDIPQFLELRGGSISTASVGTPTYTAKPAPLHRVIHPLDTGWIYDPGEYPRYQTNHWDMPRAPGAYRSAFVPSADRGGQVLQVELTNPNQNAPMVGFYGQFVPDQPIVLDGRPRALGLWVNGRSAWNRYIYEITDAKGEVWLSCGTRDAWNCDDIMSWSSANHDGWRYLRFPLPATAPGDNYREADTTWWGSDGDGIVDLPLTLTRMLVEMRPQMVYVNDMIPVDSLQLEFDDLTVEYANESDMTDAPVALQTAAAEVLMKGELLPLPNPFTELQATGVGDAPSIADVYPPDQFNNGARLFVDVSPVAGAERYRGYVAAYPDGRGAQALAISQKDANNWAKRIENSTTLFYNNLLPERPMYIFVTYVDADGKESKPSAMRTVVLKDEFPFK